jgi:hypothetical protein
VAETGAAEPGTRSTSAPASKSGSR